MSTDEKQSWFFVRDPMQGIPPQTGCPTGETKKQAIPALTQGVNQVNQKGNDPGVSPVEHLLPDRSGH